MFLSGANLLKLLLVVYVRCFHWQVWKHYVILYSSAQGAPFFVCLIDTGAGNIIQDATLRRGMPWRDSHRIKSTPVEDEHSRWTNDHSEIEKFQPARCFTEEEWNRM